MAQFNIRNNGVWYSHCDNAISLFDGSVFREVLAGAQVYFGGSFHGLTCPIAEVFIKAFLASITFDSKWEITFNAIDTDGVTRPITVTLDPNVPGSEFESPDGLQIFLHNATSVLITIKRLIFNGVTGTYEDDTSYPLDGGSLAYHKNGSQVSISNINTNDDLSNVLFTMTSVTEGDLLEVFIAEG